MLATSIVRGLLLVPWDEPDKLLPTLSENLDNGVSYSVVSPIDSERWTGTLFTCDDGSIIICIIFLDRAQLIACADYYEEQSYIVPVGVTHAGTSRRGSYRLAISAPPHSHDFINSKGVIMS